MDGNEGEAAQSCGTMLWFNTAKDRGVVETEGGDRLDVPGHAFAPGEKPVERCAGKMVTFGRSGSAVSGVAFVPEAAPRRARMRYHR